MADQSRDERRRRIIDRTRQLILMRETGPKSRAWHAARVRMIWRLHDELRAAEGAAPPPEQNDLDTAGHAC